MRSPHSSPGCTSRCRRPASRRAPSGPAGSTRLARPEDRRHVARAASRGRHDRRAGCAKQIAPGRSRVLRARCTEPAGRRVRPAVPRVAGNLSRRASGTGRARFADAACRRRARDPICRRCAMRCPMLSIRTETDAGPNGARCLRCTRSSRAAALATGDPPVEYCRRTEVRRSCGQPALRRWSAGARRHARRRRGGRGRHAQRAHDPGHSAATGRSARRRHRGARRSVPAATRVRADQRAAARGRRQGVRQSAQRCRRLPAPAGCRRRRRPDRSRSTPTDSAKWSDGTLRRLTAQCWTRSRTMGVPVASERRVARSVRRIWSRSTPKSRSSATDCRSTSTASSTRSTASICSASWVSYRASRAGQSRTSTRRRRN